jgi:hypothetical protein
LFLNKILSQRFFVYTSYLVIAVILSINGGKEFLHNHEADLKEPDDCPILIVNNILSTGIPDNIDFQIEFIIEATLEIPQIAFAYQSINQTNYLRGPPLI